MKNSTDGPSRLDTAEEKIRAIETIQNETWRGEEEARGKKSLSDVGHYQVV